MLDVDLSLAVARAIGATEQACWYHALRAFFAIAELQTGWYVEGFAIPEVVDPRMAVEHGWLERMDGSIIDPSWVLLGNKRVDYFPGFSYTYAHAATLAKGKKGVLLPLISQRYADPFDCPAETCRLLGGMTTIREFEGHFRSYYLLYFSYSL